MIRGILFAFTSLFAILLLSSPAKAACLIPDPAAVAEVLAGTRTEANAAWWGFDKEDSTEILQAAIYSGAKRVVVPFMGDPWIIRPITLRGGLELFFEPGVLILAKEGEFKGKGDSLFRATSVEDFRLVGYGATLRMRKKDYQSPAYEKAEWRMGVAIVGCKRVHIEGLRVESSGGDGIYIGSGGKLRWCEDVTIRNCVCHDNHRQGLSVISAVNLLVENCVFSGTDGTAPEAGIDLEPDSPDERLVNCVVRNCLFENNSGHAILVYLKPLAKESEPVSIRFENCHSRMGYRAGMTPEEFDRENLQGWSGMAVGAAKDDGPKGLIEFINCTSENTGREGAKVYDKSAGSVKVRFVNCSWRNPWMSLAADSGGSRVPVLLHTRRPNLVQDAGGVEFVDCAVHDTVYRPALQFDEDKEYRGIRDVSGVITVNNHTGAWMKLGPLARDCSVKVLEATGEVRIEGGMN
ncbi:MAG: right-handed parallel beta-helix repeat-containing protein [Candidatus Omnitrophica bacterium]|nr:right-handed parallel beta-helix repeat-containing protein [Candidatus Omnitrophota bacterium]